MADARESAAQHLELRRLLASSNGSSNAATRAELAAATHSWLRELAASALPSAGFTLVAVGGLGRGEVCAGSDIDLLLLHENAVASSEVSAAADALWYPLWDSGVRLDHSVRSVAQARVAASDDFKVLLGLLDAQVVFGSGEPLESLRSSVLADWRAMAGKRLPELRASVDERRERFGELAHLLEPDLKEAYGGLRELSVLRALRASWLTEVPLADLVSATGTLLNVRDALHRVTGRGGDRLLMQEQAAVAAMQGFESEDALLRSVSMAARTVAATSDLAWYRVNRQLRSAPRGLRRLVRGAAEERQPLADGVVAFGGEVVLAEAAAPSADAGLLLRAAAAAAQAGLVLSPATLDRLVSEGQPLSAPWPTEARDSLVSLLGAGRAALPVWEALDQAGVTGRLLPMWSDIRSLPQRNSLHVYTVDRHSVECALIAAEYAREVERPDLLLIAALFHDIGKGAPGHCERGAELMMTIAPTLGFGVADTAVLVALVRHHLLLAEVATSRDLEDPATVAMVASAVQSRAVLELLHRLTLADSQAAGPGVLTNWKRTLLDDLVSRVSAALSGVEQPAPVSLAARWPLPIDVEVTEVAMSADERQGVIHVSAPDRVGLLSTVAGALSLQRLEVRSAAMETVDGVALQEWQVLPLYGALPRPEDLRRDLLHALAHSDTVARRVVELQPTVRSRGFVPPPPRVRMLPGASATATVLEVRAHDAPALLHRVTAVIADAGFNLVSARVSTLGSEVVDVLYLQSGGAVLSADQEQALVAAVLSRLS